MAKSYQVTVRGDVPVTAGKIQDYGIARQVADGMCAQYHIPAQIKDEATGEIVYSIEPFAENVIPLRPDIRPQGEEHGTEHDIPRD